MVEFWHQINFHKFNSSIVIHGYNVVGDVMDNHSSCIFCKIIAGEAEASIVYQDESVTAFMDIQPLFQGHVLVVPNEHFTGLTDLEDSYGAQMFRLARRLAKAILRSNLKCEGVNLFLADGPAAGQTVFHSHLHVIPRYPGDGFQVHHPSGYGHRPARRRLDEVALQIKDALGQEQ
jgi:histidine triad (HIT) family protein